MYISISDILFGIALVITVALVVIAIMHIFVRVPYIPTPKKVMKEMLDAANLTSGQVVYDLGAGDGRFLIFAKRMCPGIKAKGCEMMPFVWVLGRMRILLSREEVEYRLGNALHQDVRDADVLFLYLLPSLMHKLEERFEKELKPRTRVFSHVFTFKNKKPVRKLICGGKTVWEYEW
jgi:ubiquinone/menaquinone biosynthesis C-methylase UbiE